eukprot:CAMPEP_0174279404 /NCGR_PEP_ID=MMETSP0439-20130205/62014_1 /TAXON_ID=0 /ORGANISM="Stereomyxa ramosa, Strain Chinc5" /LENGTH=430 /DNA_ID=CAMNT_0015371923 /DNA_START=631 /DNA_END=1923 /DNA_ORIENTATION=+
MEFLHKNSIIHRDLKPENLLMFSHDPEFSGPIVKICDFGISTLLQKAVPLTKGVGTLEYTAPEILNGSDKYGFPVDVFSYGVIIWQLISRDRLYSDVSVFYIADEVMAGKRPPITGSFPEPWVELMSQCWDENPERRPTFCKITKILDNFTTSNMFTDLCDFEEGEVKWDELKFSGKVIYNIGQTRIERATFREQPVVVKLQEVPKSSEYIEDLTLIQQKMSDLLKVSHDNVVKFYGGGFINRKIFLVSRYYKLRDLKELIKNKLLLPLQLKIKMIIEIITALQFVVEQCDLHHPELTCEHIFINSLVEEPHIKLNLSLHFTQPNPETSPWSTHWIAPEILQGDCSEQSLASNIYSLGIVAWQILENDVPYGDVKPKWKLPMEVINGKRPTISEKSEDFKHILLSSWHTDPLHRPSLPQLLHHFQMKLSD